MRDVKAEVDRLFPRGEIIECTLKEGQYMPSYMEVMCCNFDGTVRAKIKNKNASRMDYVRDIPYYRITRIVKE